MIDFEKKLVDLVIEKATWAIGYIDRLEAQISALKAENERLSGKTGFCQQCEDYARRIEKLKASGDAMEKSLESLLNFGGVPLRDIYKLDVGGREKYLVARKAMEGWQKAVKK